MVFPLAALLNGKRHGGAYSLCYAYDFNGNVSSKTENRGNVIAYVYDELNRPKTKSYNGQIAVNYTYDDAAVNYSRGRVTAVATTSAGSTNASTTNYVQYDALGRIVQSSQTTLGNIYPFSYTYNAAGSVVSETYPSHRVIAYAYDGANRPVGVSGTLGSASTAYASSFTYAPQGAPSSYSYGNLLSRTNTYNNRLQLASFADAIGNDPTQSLLIETSNWGSTNNNGNLQGTTTFEGGPGAQANLAQFSRVFTYDSINRLASATETSAACSGTCWYRYHQYDAFGNMWVAKPDGSAGYYGIGLNPATPVSNVYNSNNQRTDLGSGAYDAAGDQQVTMLGGLALTYDAEGRQITAGGYSYSYDGDGKRVAKVGAGGTTVYVYDAGGGLSAEYSNVANTSTCGTCYLSYDVLGTTRLVTDAGHNVVSRHDYLPFGEEIAGNSVGRDGHFRTV